MPEADIPLANVSQENPVPFLCSARPEKAQPIFQLLNIQKARDTLPIVWLEKKTLQTSQHHQGRYHHW